MKKNEIILAMTVVALSLALIVSEVIAVGTTRSTFKVENLSCGSCLSKINYELKEYEGMVGMGADLLKGLVTVDYKAPLTGDHIASVITALGYPATLLDESEVADLQEEPEGHDQQKNSAGPGCSGCKLGGECAGSASTWKQFYQRFKGNENAPQDNQ
jgi:copper chaperone CopZ